jgi:small subunit ribosomal protein S18
MDPRKPTDPRRRRPRGTKDRRPRKKFCTFCAEKVEYIDYKDANKLRKFLSEKGKIIPRRVTGNCAKHQRALTRAILRGRVMALLPYVVD